MYDYSLDTNSINDKEYSTQPALELSTKLDRPVQCPVVGDEFQLILNYEEVVQSKYSGM